MNYYLIVLERKVKFLPNLLTYGGLIIYYSSQDAQEPIHVHVVQGKPSHASTKFWLLSDGNLKLANNHAELSAKQIKLLEKFIKINFNLIVENWKRFFNVSTVKYYE